MQPVVQGEDKEDDSEQDARGGKDMLHKTLSLCRESGSKAKPIEQEDSSLFEDDMQGRPVGQREGRLRL
jgi:hypothetical protein